ncbi:HAD family hydrolase [Hyphococcus sp.]|uniref:sulfotransferase-like domain-containing protein n=1 Tax=Hyphococcus sp. TaxID=2038636 RepID=UPI003CCBC96F
MAVRPYSGFRRIAMLSGPRNISTTMMRAFESRPDTAVVDEPFYASYLEASGALHPMRKQIIAAQSSDWKQVLEQLNEHKNKQYQYTFEKHIAFHFSYAPQKLNWPENALVFQLIREPRATIASYHDKYEDVTPIIDSYKIQREIFENTNAPILDSTEILKSPKRALVILCDALNIPFFDEMLAWKQGPHESDGPWASHWYKAVWESSGFREYKKKPINLTSDLENVVKKCTPDYEILYHSRLKVD